MLTALLIVSGCNKKSPDVASSVPVELSSPIEVVTVEPVKETLKSIETVTLSGIYSLADGEAMKILVNDYGLEDNIISVEFLKAGVCSITYASNYNEAGRYTVVDDQVTVGNPYVDYIFSLKGKTLTGITGPVRNIVYVKE
ncbi:MAG: hypothetical protein LBJ31_07660 [Treponema sp.]|jgi:hypothetical protein|nr:hypothetical protein [Treponema sp.]